MSSSNKSIIFYTGFRDKSFCGYCKKDNNSCSYGMWASCLTVQAYQDMIDRGWRRSGKYCYKPLMDKTCCPQYAIRCKALDFQLSKSQKKVIKKVTTFLKSGECNKIPFGLEQAERESQMKHESQEDNSIMKPVNSNSTINSKEEKKVKLGEGADPNLPLCKKKKKLRLEKKLAKNPNSVIKNPVLQQKSLEDFISENDLVSTAEDKKLRIKFLKITSSSSSFEAEYAVYKLYQTTVHNDIEADCTREQFIRFLVNSPLQAEKADHPNHPGYGSFHQQYWLGDKLIAVGVIDILPKCVSSVYLFYDPDYHHMVLGTYSSLRELYLVRQLHKISPDLKYYYMGFYIHTCPKMRYKAQIRPSYLLCPLKYTWHEIDKCIQKLNDTNYSIFDESDDIEINDTFRIENIPVLFSGSLMTYSMYKRMRSMENQDELITEYTKLVGLKLAKELIYCFLD